MTKKAYAEQKAARARAAARKKYQLIKENIRNNATSWQNNFERFDFAYGEIAEIQAFFAKLAKRFGLTREFRENGII